MNEAELLPARTAPEGTSPTRPEATRSPTAAPAADPAPPDAASARPDPSPAGNGDASGFHPTGALIRQLRSTSGFSVAEFAELLRVSAATVRRWEAVSGSLTLRSGPRDALQTLNDAIGASFTPTS